jgi:hypothetical protein
LAPATLTVNITCDNTTADNYLTLREAILLVNNGGNANAALGRSLTTGEANQIVGSFGTNDTIQTIQFALPWNDPGHIYYQGQVTDANAVQVPKVAIDGTTAIMNDSQLLDASKVGTGNTIAPAWPHRWWRIQPSTPLPQITNRVFIDGHSQHDDYGQDPPSENTLTVGDNAVLRVSLDGMEAGPGIALDIRAAYSTVRDLAIANWGAGISIASTQADINGVLTSNPPTDSFGAPIGGSWTSSNDVVEGNFIGLDPSETIAERGSLGEIDTQVYLDAAGPNTIIGGTTPAARNVITGAGFDILIQFSPGATVEGNYIGTNAAGTAALPGLYTGGGGNNAVQIAFSEDDTISGDLISGSSSAGISLGSGSGIGAHNKVQDNLIGTDASGTRALPNGEGGILVSEINDQITGNTIAFNDRPGVSVSGMGDTIEGNSIFGNTGLGIDLGGIYANAPGGPFNPANGPTFTNLTQTLNAAGTLFWTGTLNGQPNTTYTVAFNILDPVTRAWDGSWFPPFDLTTDASGQVAFGYSDFAPNGTPYPPGFPNTPGSIPGSATAATHPLGNFQENYPLLSAASSTASSVTVSGTFNSSPNHTYRLEFFSNSSPGRPDTNNPADTKLYGDGQTYLGSTQVTTDPTNGNASFTTTLATPVLVGQGYITATATDVTTGAVGYGDTSEFSPDFTAGNLAPVNSTSLQNLITSATPAGGMTTAVFQATDSTEANNLVAAISGLGAQANPVTVMLNLAPGTYSGETVAVPDGMTLVINGTPSNQLPTTVDPATPAFVVQSGNVIISNVTFTESGDAPTILVTGGSLTLRNDTVQGTTGFSDPAISVTGGTLDLGTTAQPGGNTINLNGSGQFVQKLTPNPIAATGDSFEVGGTPLPAPSLSFTTLTASTANSIPGQSVTFTATVRANGSGSGTPTGTIDFVDTSTNTDLGSVPLSGGVATLSTAALELGTHVIRAKYSGDSGFLPSLDSLTQVVTQSVFVLNGTASGAVSVAGNASMAIPGNLVVDSNSKTALTESGNAQVTAATIQVVGGVQKGANATLTGVLTSGVASVPDPLAALSGPGTAGLTSYGPVSYSGNGSYPLKPGIYSQISASGSVKLTLSPGLYLIEGGGFTVTGNASVTGTGVTIYNTGSNYPSAGGSFGGITLSGNGTFSLNAATTSANGAYPGVVIYQARANTRALSLSGNAAAGLQGTIYAPNAGLVLSGNAQLNAAVVAGTLSLTGTGGLTQTATGSDGTGDTSGIADSLLAGNLYVYVNDPAGYFTADQVARIQDAINGWDALLVPYNVTVTEVSDPSLANLVLDNGTTSACGGASNGVLGCFNNAAGEITLIQGWNWYAGADASQIGPGQYDFQTTVTHELGHALGLGGSDDPTSPMNETLPAGIARRTMTAADLNIPEAPVGADALTAAGFQVVSEVGPHGQASVGETPVTTGKAAGATSSVPPVLMNGPASLPAASASAPVNDLAIWSSPFAAGEAIPGALRVTIRVPAAPPTDAAAPTSPIASASRLPLTTAVDLLFRERPGFQQLGDASSPDQQAEAVPDGFRSAQRQGEDQAALKGGQRILGTGPWDAGWQGASPGMPLTDADGGWNMSAWMADAGVGAEALALALAAACAFQPPEETGHRERRRGRRLGARA